MTIILNLQQEQFIQEKLGSGKYKNAEEVIFEAFRLLEERDKNYEEWVKETRKKVEIGIEQLDRNEGIDGEIVINRLKEKIRRLRDG